MVSHSVCKFACFVELDQLITKLSSIKIYNLHYAYCNFFLCFFLSAFIREFPTLLHNHFLKTQEFVVKLQEDFKSIVVLIEKVVEYAFIQNDLDFLVFAMFSAEATFFPFLDISAIAAPSVNRKTFKIMTYMLIELEALLA